MMQVDQKAPRPAGSPSTQNDQRPAVGFMLTQSHASRFSSLALAHVEREYPNKLDQVLSGTEDVLRPRDLHPVFYGSFDWHSCVHGYWLLLRLYRRLPQFPERERIRELVDRRITPEGIAGELAYLARPLSGTFERPYGWAWFLMLAGELSRHQSEEGRRWFATLQPIAIEIAVRFASYLPRLTYPVRTGTHSSTAFAISLALDYADAAGDDEFASRLRGRARDWFERDTAYQGWEPSGEDFLSPALVEAECMRRVLPRELFRNWLESFLPELDCRRPASLFTPVEVSDRSDGRIAHLDGLNLSKAWCWRSIASVWSPDDRRKTIVMKSAQAHLEASLPYVSGDYMGEHWLATFALLAIDVGEDSDIG